MQKEAWIPAAVESTEERPRNDTPSKGPQTLHASLGTPRRSPATNLISFAISPSGSKSRCRTLPGSDIRVRDYQLWLPLDLPMAASAEGGRAALQALIEAQAL
jgi:hypothetical protein